MVGISKYDEIERHLRHAQTSLEKLVLAADGSELRDCWEAFLVDFSSAIGKMIAFAQREVTSRPFGHKLKNASRFDDEGLVFLREARNVAVHGLEPFADFTNPSVNISGAILMSGNSSAAFSNTYINGVNIGNFSIETKNGRVNRISGRPNTQISEVPASIKLKPVKNPEKKAITPVPTSVFGIKVEGGSPDHLAKTALDGLRNELLILREILQ